MDITMGSALSQPIPNGADSLRNKLERVDGSRIGGEDPKKLRQACEEFESYFIYMLQKEMRKTVPENKFLHGGRGEEIFRDMMDEEIAKNMAHSKTGGIGIADILYKQLSRTTITKPNVPGVPGIEEPGK